MFVLGDNRDKRSDSRYWGYVPQVNIQGVVRFIWWSASGSGMRVAMRWDRVDTLVR